MSQGDNRTAAIGVPFLYPIVAEGVAARAQNVVGDVPVKDEYVHVEDPSRTGGVAATKSETTGNTAAKPEGAEDAHVALEDQEKGGVR